MDALSFTIASVSGAAAIAAAVFSGWTWHYMRVDRAKAAQQRTADIRPRVKVHMVDGEHLKAKAWNVGGPAVALLILIQTPEGVFCATHALPQHMSEPTEANLRFLPLELDTPPPVTERRFIATAAKDQDGDWWDVDTNLRIPDLVRWLNERLEWSGIAGEYEAVPNQLGTGAHMRRRAA